MAVSDAQYASFIDRLIACRDAEDRAKADTKAVYAELADAGEDKTAAGLLVREQRMSNKDRVKADFREAAVEDGRARYRRGKASHVRAREERVDPETGEITESANTSFPPEVAAAVTDEKSVSAAKEHSHGSDAGSFAPYQPHHVSDLPKMVEANESLDDLAVQDGLKMSSDGKPSSGLHSDGANAGSDQGVTGGESAATQSTGNVGGSAGRERSGVEPSTESTASVPVDTHSYRPITTEGLVSVPHHGGVQS